MKLPIITLETAQVLFAQVSIDEIGNGSEPQTLKMIQNRVVMTMRFKLWMFAIQKN